tara:strand:- start:21264 stop:21509 length:246 start_codon:yes stop_codon:yes gene_type:complete
LLLAFYTFIRQFKFVARVDFAGVFAGMFVITPCYFSSYRIDATTPAFTCSITLQEPSTVQAFKPQLAVERFDIPIFARLLK